MNPYSTSMSPSPSSFLSQSPMSFSLSKYSQSLSGNEFMMSKKKPSQYSHSLSSNESMSPIISPASSIVLSGNIKASVSSSSPSLSPSFSPSSSPVVGGINNNSSSSSTANSSSSSSSSSSSIPQVPHDVYNNYWVVLTSSGELCFYDCNMDSVPRFSLDLDTMRYLMTDSSNSQYYHRLILFTSSDLKISLHFESLAEFSLWQSEISELSPSLY
jgi:hypothetical protein